MRGTQISPVQIVLPIVSLLGLALAYFFGSAIAQEQYFLLLGIVILIGITAWAVLGRSVWWLPMMFLPALGGMFYVGFKIHVHELALIVAMIPLVLLIALNRSDIQARKHTVQGIILLLIIYLCLHFLACLVYLKINALPGIGNVVRRYTDAIWPIMFLVPFLYFAKTKFLKWAMHLVFLANLARFSVGLYTVYTGGKSLLYIPLINFVPAGGMGGSDLRTSGPMLVALGIVYFCLHRNILFRSLMFLMIALGLWGTFLGSSRLVLVSAFFLIAFPLIIYRQFGILLLGFSLFVIGIIFINATPTSLYALPEAGRRAASAFLFDRGLATDTAGTDLSDQWHFRLMNEGWKSWTDNAFTILFGRGTRAFEEKAWDGGQNFEGMIEMAVATSRFEKGLWDTLCTFGITGFILFITCMGYVIQRCLKELARQKISSYALGLAFIGSFQCISWIMLCWIGGTFPSTQIMLGLVALVAIDDDKAKLAAKEKKALTTPAITPPQTRGNPLPNFVPRPRRNFSN